jgi:hypothetical protein
MLSFEPELERLRQTLGDATADALIARERREVFSVHPELRIASWAGAMLLATAAGIVLKNNLDRIGPLALAVLIALAAAACYAWTWRQRQRASVIDDAILLLGALLVSADVAFIETQFDLLGEAWHRHFLIVAVLHGVAAYLYRSRALLSLAIAAAAAWLGVRDGFEILDNAIDYALRAAAASALVLAWRRVNRRDEFHGTLEHFAALFALLAGFALMFDYSSRTLGCLATMVIATLIIAWGFRTRRESFVFYAFLAGVVAIDVLLIDAVNEAAIGFFIIVISMIAAIATLIVIHAKFRELSA